MTVVAGADDTDVSTSVGPEACGVAFNDPADVRIAVTDALGSLAFSAWGDVASRLRVCTARSGSLEVRLGGC